MIFLYRFPKKQNFKSATSQYCYGGPYCIAEILSEKQLLAVNVNQCTRWDYVEMKDFIGLRFSKQGTNTTTFPKPAAVWMELKNMIRKSFCDIFLIFFLCSRSGFGRNDINHNHQLEVETQKHRLISRVRRHN